MRLPFLRNAIEVRKEKINKVENHLSQWHSKFLWLPTDVSDKSESSEYKWLEFVYRRGVYGTTRYAGHDHYVLLHWKYTNFKETW